MTTIYSVSYTHLFEVEEPAPVKPTGQPTTEESSATSAPTEAEALEREKEQFMASLPVFESGKNAGQVDQSQMTPGQNLRYFEYCLLYTSRCV